MIPFLKRIHNADEDLGTEILISASVIGVKKEAIQMFNNKGRVKQIWYICMSGKLCSL